MSDKVYLVVAGNYSDTTPILASRSLDVARQAAALVEGRVYDESGVLVLDSIAPPAGKRLWAVAAWGDGVFVERLTSLYQGDAEDFARAWAGENVKLSQDAHITHLLWLADADDYEDREAEALEIIRDMEGGAK